MIQKNTKRHFALMGSFLNQVSFHVQVLKSTIATSLLRFPFALKGVKNRPIKPPRNNPAKNFWCAGDLAPARSRISTLTLANPIRFRFSLTPYELFTRGNHMKRRKAMGNGLVPGMFNFHLSRFKPLKIPAGFVPGAGRCCAFRSLRGPGSCAAAAR